MIRIAAAAFTALSLTVASAPVTLAQDAPIDTLFTALGLPETVDVMREEGLNYGGDLQAGLLGGQGGTRWPDAVSEIYDAERLTAGLRDHMAADLADSDLTPMIAFFTSDLGQRIVALEVSARQAFLEDEIEELARASFEALLDDDADRAALIKTLVARADLIESNVVGALNSNYAFYLGLVEGGGLPGNPSDEEILSDVWAQEPDIRNDTTEWLYSYLNLAYQPLGDDELQAYIDFYDSDAGKVLNRAMFAAFDDMFSSVSFALGSAAAGFMGGEEL